MITLWIIDSYDYGNLLMFSKDTKILETKSYDELFGTEIIKTQTSKGFWLGLLPADNSLSFKPFVAVVPLISFLILIRIITYFINKKRKE